MKKLLFILAALCCTMVASAQNTPPNNEIWYTSTDGKVVTPNKANAFNVGITSNEYKNGKGILTFAGDLTSIGDWAFTSCSSLATIAIPSSVTNFGKAAFRDCVNLSSSITVSGSVGESAFQNCTNLSSSITVGGSVGGYAFNGCTNLKSVTVKDGTTIERNAFNGCNGEFIFEGVTYVGYLGFKNCPGLTSITIGGSVGGYAFADCANLKTVTVKDGTTIGESAFNGYKGEFIFEGCVTNVGEKGFQNCTGLTSITVSGSVGGYAFNGCTNLKSVITKDCTSIGGYAFQNCTGLTSLTVSGSVGEYAFAGCTNLKSITIKDGTTIEQNAFDGYKGGFIFEGCVTNVGYDAFCNCTGLTSITVSGSVGGEAFAGCTNLKSVITKDCTGIGGYAFWNCTGLTSITVGGSVGGYAFNGCTNLKTVTIKDGTTIGESAFNGYKGEFIFEGCVTNVGGKGFQNCTGLTSITASGSVGEYAFNGCTNLESITINDSPNVGRHAFNGCTGLKSMVINSDAPPFLEDRVILFEGVNPDIPIYVNNAVAYYRSIWGKHFTNFIGNMISHKSQAVNEINAQRQGITLSEEEAAAIETCIKTINDIPDGARMTDERLATIKKAEAAALAIINKDKFRKEKDAATAEVAALVPKGLEGDYLTEVLQEQMNAINAANTIVGLNAAKENAIAVINKALAVCQVFLGTLGTKQSGHSVEVTDQNGQVIRLYNPKTVMYVKVKEDDANAPAE